MTTANGYPIGRHELAFYFAVCICHAAASIWLSMRASNFVGDWLNFSLKESPYSSSYKMDNSDIEWLLFREAIVHTIIGYAIHSVVLRASTHITNSRARSLVLIAFWLCLTVWLTTMRCATNCALFCIFVTLCTLLTRSELIAWLLSVLFVCKCGSSWIQYDVSSPQTYYREYQLYIYFSIRVLNFNIHISRNSSVKFNVETLLLYAEYLLYPPYSSLLIVLYEDFCKQRQKAILNAPRWRQCAFFALRLIFWFYVVEFALHFTRVNAFFNSPFTLVNNLNNYEIFSIAYIRGQFFHTKYVVIFGVPRLFSLLDGMEPSGAAICISRISKYSRMWRYFDRGLYTFLKTQLYVPLIRRAPNAHVGRLLAMLIVFGFVLIWHGVNFNFCAWVALSAIELIIERIGAAFYQSAACTRLRHRLGSEAFARLCAVALLTNVVPGIFGAFFFLSAQDLASTIFSRVFVEGVRQILLLKLAVGGAGFVFLHLLALGYCYSHVCTYLHIKLADDKRNKLE